MPGRIYYARSSLSPEEKKLKEIMQAILVKIKVLKGTTDQEWNDFATRKALRGFPELMKHLQERVQQAQEPQGPASAREKKQERGKVAPTRPSTSRGSRGSGTKDRSRTPRS